MRSQADTAQTRPASRVRPAVALSIGLLLVAALVPAVPARADNHRPWDQPGSSWQGTIQTSLDYEVRTGDSHGTVGWDWTHSATYTELSPRGSTADGLYAGHVAGTGTYVAYSGNCPSTGEPYQINGSWGVDETASSDQALLSLETMDDGVTYFAPHQYYVSRTDKWICSEDGSESVGESDQPALAFESEYPSSLTALPDSDPDPLHLVGSKTWTLGDPPYELYFAGNWPGPHEYTFTATYDLRLVTDDCVDTNVTHDIYQAAYPSEFEVRVGEFELRTAWCITEAGEIRVAEATARGETIRSPLEAAVAKNLELFFNVSDKWTANRVEQTVFSGQTVVTGSGKWKSCFGIPIPLKVKYLRGLSNVFLEIAAKTENRAVRKVAFLAADLLEQAANKLKDGFRWLAKKAVDLLLEALVRLPEKVSRRILDLVVSGIIDWEKTPAEVQDYVKSGIIAKDLLIKQVINNEFCGITAWKPMIEHTLHSSGLDDSRFIDLDFDHPWVPIRTGGSD